MLDRVPDFADFECSDCGHNTSSAIGVAEYYMLRHEVWQRVSEPADLTEQPAYMLCIGCAERRLGRQLEPDDFLPCPLNHSGIIDQSLRLTQRILGRCTHEPQEEDEEASVQAADGRVLNDPAATRSAPRAAPGAETRG